MSMLCLSNVNHLSLQILAVILSFSVTQILITFNCLIGINHPNCSDESSDCISKSSYIKHHIFLLLISPRSIAATGWEVLICLLTIIVYITNFL